MCNKGYTCSYSYAIVTVTPMSSRAPGTTTEPKITSGKNFIKITSVGMGAAKSNETR